MTLTQYPLSGHNRLHILLYEESNKSAQRGYLRLNGYKENKGVIIKLFIKFIKV